MNVYSEKYKRDPLMYVRSIMLWSTFAFTLTPLRNEHFLPYYLGIVTAIILTSIVVIILKCKHGAGKDAFTWVGGLLPIVFGTTVMICWFMGNRVQTNWWGLKLLMVLLFIPLSIVLRKCDNESVRDSANTCITYIVMCMSFTQV